MCRLLIRGRRRNVCARITAFIVSFLLLTYLCVHNVRCSIPKLFPTSFPPNPQNTTSLSELPISLPPPQEKPFRTIDKKTLNIDGDRYIFLRKLANGFEGQSRIYLDSKTRQEVVIKTFFGSTRTNPLPEHLKGVFNPHREKWWSLGGVGEFILWPLGIVEGGWGRISSWPSEIPSTLWFTGPRGDDPQGEGRKYVEVLDYFYLDNRWIKNQWQLVMPLYEVGTIDGLAKLVRHLRLRPEEIDRVYRPRFIEYLESLGRLHKEVYCHNDIKVDNIFISHQHNSTITWLVSDLGSIREFSHPYHGRNCRINDVESALKTYIWFLRLASGGQNSEFRKRVFDQEFYQGKKGWSWLYWEWRSLSREKLEEKEDLVGELKRVFELEERRHSSHGAGKSSSSGKGPSRIPIVGDSKAEEEEAFIQRVLTTVDDLSSALRWWKRGNMGKPEWLKSDDFIVDGWKREDTNSGLEEAEEGAGSTSQLQQQQVIQGEDEIDPEVLAEAISYELGRAGKRGMLDILWRKLDGPS